MSMTIGEAQAFNDLMRFLLGAHPSEPLHTDISPEKAREAISKLAKSANKALMAGLNEERAVFLFERLYKATRIAQSPAPPSPAAGRLPRLDATGVPAVPGTRGKVS